MLDIRGSYAGAMGIPQFMPSSYRKYAVDFNGNHKTNLMDEPADAIGSVANYLQGYGWIEGERVAVRVQAVESIRPGGDVEPQTVAAWGAAGVVPSVNLSQDKVARLMEFTMGEGKEYWLAFNNFDVITRYNNSDFYAMTVFQLAEALKEARKSSVAK